MGGARRVRGHVGMDAPIIIPIEGQEAGDGAKHDRRGVRASRPTAALAWSVAHDGAVAAAKSPAKAAAARRRSYHLALPPPVSTCRNSYI